MATLYRATATSARVVCSHCTVLCTESPSSGLIYQCTRLRMYGEKDNVAQPVNIDLVQPCRAIPFVVRRRLWRLPNGGRRQHKSRLFLSSSFSFVAQNQTPVLDYLISRAEEGAAFTTSDTQFFCLLSS